MLSYRHSFHAGNFADVLKHTVAVSILDYMLKKDKPLCYLDTHSGCGAYSLHSQEALKTKEYNNGIFPLWGRNDLPAPVANYMQQVIEFNAEKLDKALTLFPEYEPFQRNLLERHVVSLHKRILRSAENWDALAICWGMCPH